MFRNDRLLPLARRSFLSRFGVGVAAAGASFAAGASPAQAQTAPAGSWRPSRHAQDDWFDRLPGAHRFVFDTTTPEGFGWALFYASNYFVANQTGYGLKDADLAVVIVARSGSTPFAYNDAMWAKYGAALVSRTNFKDPKTRQVPSINVYGSSGYGTSLPNNDTTLDSVLKHGVQLAVCQMATRFFAGVIAGTNGGNANAIYDELVANVAPNSHMVPAGIVAVNRAQERGYSFVHAV